MRHLGDITQISGYDVPTVEVVIGGSPCQDLSVAGKREGYKNELKEEIITLRDTYNHLIDLEMIMIDKMDEMKKRKEAEND